jgi:hypothetical protein
MVILSAEFIHKASAFGAEPPQIWPHLPALLFRALLSFRGICNPNISVPVMRFGIEISLASE